MLNPALGRALREGSETLGGPGECLPPFLWDDLIPRDKPGYHRCFLGLPPLHVDLSLLRETGGREERGYISESDRPRFETQLCHLLAVRSQVNH